MVKKLIVEFISYFQGKAESYFTKLPRKVLRKFKNLISPTPKILPSPEISVEIRGTYNQSRSLNIFPTACYAPFTSLYFGHNGKVTACCYNRIYELGTITQQSVKEIWLGDKVQQLRNHLSEYNFSLGCSSCKNQIVVGNMEGVKTKQYDRYAVRPNTFPRVLEFELNNTCNLECIMCNGDYSSLIRINRENRPELANPYGDDFIQQLEEFIPYLEEVKFYGGEPFLIDAYFKIWGKIIEVNPSIRMQVQTNGTILNKRVKNILSKGRFDINLSIDSLQKKNYEKIRVNADYERVMKHLYFFHQYCKEKGTQFALSACLMQQNYFEAGDLVRIANKLNAPLYFHTVFQPRNASLRCFPKTELQRVYYEIQDRLTELPEGTPIELKNKCHYVDFLKQISAWIEELSSSSLDEIDSLQKLLDFISDRTFSRTGITLQEKQRKITTISNKLVSASSLLPSHINIFDHLKQFNLSNQHQANNYLDSLENISEQELLDYLIWKV